VSSDVNKRPTRLNWTRWLLILALIGAGFGLIKSDAWQSCRTVLPNVGQAGTVRECEEPAIGDSVSLLGLLLIFLLLLPDLGEISLPGGIGLKRRIDVQQEQIRAQNERQQLLEQRFALVAESQAQASAVGNIVLGGYDAEQLAGLISNAVDQRIRLRELEEEPVNGEPAAPEEERAREKASIAEEIKRLTSLQILELERELVRRWRVLGPLVRLADAAAAGPLRAVRSEVADRLASLSEREVARLITWRDAYATGIRAVDDARRAIVADPSALTQQELVRVTVLARELEASASDLGLLDTDPE